MSKSDIEKAALEAEEANKWIEGKLLGRLLLFPTE